MDYTEGDRVTHTRWGTTGTVHVSGDDVLDVEWDGGCVTDELAAVAADLRPA